MPLQRLCKLWREPRGRKPSLFDKLLPDAWPCLFLGRGGGVWQEVFWGEWLGFLRALAMLWQAPLTLVKTVSRASACWEQPCRENVSLKRCLLYIPYVFLQIQHMGARGSYLGPSPGSGLRRKVRAHVLFSPSMQEKEILSLFCNVHKVPCFSQR